MELETYESDLLAFALEEQPFYETKPSFYDLQMASQLINGQLNNQNGGHYNQMNNLSMPLLNNGIISSGKHKKKKSVKFNNNLTIKTYVQVSTFIYDLKTIYYFITHRNQTKSNKITNKQKTKSGKKSNIPHEHQFHQKNRLIFQLNRSKRTKLLLNLN